MSNEENKLEIVQKYYIRKGNGEIDYEHPYDLIEKANTNGLYYVILDGHVGYMDEKGEFVIPISYDSTRTTYKGETNYSRAESWEYYNESTSITSVFKDNKVGVITNSGKELVPCEFEDVKPFCFSTSESFIPVALPSHDKKKLVWGMYDIKNKRVSTTPQYDDIVQERNGYASFEENGRWGLLHCATGTVVIPAIYLLEMNVLDTGIVIAFLGGTWGYAGKNCKGVNPDDSNVLVVNGIEQAPIILSGYKWIEETGPSVVKCLKKYPCSPEEEESFKILKMPNYIGIVKNASYEEGFFLKESGKFVKDWTPGCKTYSHQIHAKYLSGGVFSAKTYDGKAIPVTEEMEQEILKRISEE